MDELGKILVGVGISIAVLGGVVVLLGRVPGIGHLPGDFTIRTEGLSCFVPLATSILLSLLATIVLNLILRIINR